MTDKKDILRKHMEEGFPSSKKEMEQIPQLVKEEASYEAFEEFKSRKSPRFRIIDANGKSYLCSYAHLIGAVFEPPTLLTINTATHIFTIQGKNLERIEDLLAEDKIKKLYIFNPQRYKPVPEDKPIIENLTVIEHF